MYLTATPKLRANNHDARLLRDAARAWHSGMQQAVGALRRRQPELLACLEWREGRAGRRLRVNAVLLDGLVKQAVPKPLVGLHSSARMSMVVAVTEMLSSWLGQRAVWETGGMRGPAPGFPSVPALTDRHARRLYDEAMERSASVGTLAEENDWRAEVTRLPKPGRVPQYFGAMSAGIGGVSHAGILRRDDGRLYALLALWPQGHRNGATPELAANRRDRGELRNIRLAAVVERWTQQLVALGEAPEGETPADAKERVEKAEKLARKIMDQGGSFSPGAGKAAIMVPLETDARTERLYQERGEPKSAEVVYRDGSWYLHYAAEIKEPPPTGTVGPVLAVQRGITTLLAAVVMDADGRVLERCAVSDEHLAGKITAILDNRAAVQAQGRLTTGDRRAARLTEETLYHAAHELVALACKYGVQEVVFRQEKDPRKGTPPAGGYRRGRARPFRYMMAYRHYLDLLKLCSTCLQRAGAPAVTERKLYGSHATCVACGWAPGDPVRHEDVGRDTCPGCRRPREREWQVPELLALNALWLRVDREARPKFGQWVRTIARGL